MSNYKGRIPGSKNKSIKQEKRIIYSISIYSDELDKIKKLAKEKNISISRFLIENSLSS